MAAIDIFQVRKYSAMTIAARIRKVISPRMAVLVMSAPQVAPTNDDVTSLIGTL